MELGKAGPAKERVKGDLHRAGGTLIDPAERLIVALDVPDLGEAAGLVSILRGLVRTYKVGLELFTAEGRRAVDLVLEHGGKVFLDLKLHDIPATVERAAKAAARSGASMLTVHLGGGREMIRAAVEGASSGLLVLGVTVLTSIDEAALRTDLRIPGGIQDHVLHLAGLGAEEGAGGVVASPLEAGELHRRFGGRLALVTPGIRPGGAEAGDQKRILTPGAAIEAGADYLVVGRPVTKASDPAEAAGLILGEIAAACG